MKPLQDADWPRLLRSGCRVFVSTGATTPHQLVLDALQTAPAAEDLQFHHGLSVGQPPWAAHPYRSRLRRNAFYLDPRHHQLLNTGHDDYTPSNHADIPSLFQERIVDLDLALIMVTPPDAYGYCSLGPNVDLTLSALQVARTVVAEINPRMPRTAGQSFIHIDQIDYARERSTALPAFSRAQLTPEATKIGQYVAQLIEDGSTLQLGVSALAEGVAAALKNHRHLGIHTEVFGEALMELFQLGIVDNGQKNFLPGKMITGCALGSQRLYDFIHDNPHLDFRPTEWVNSPLNIAKNNRMVSVNSALQVDLTGQVVVDSLQSQFRSGMGSQADFVRGASMSQGGRPIIALPSTDQVEGRTVSTIVAELEPGAGVGCTRADVHYVVTEYGVASLRGRSTQERVLELIEVAHPDFREELLAQARKHNLVPAFFVLPPPYEGEGGAIAYRKVRLRDDRHYILRPLNPADDRRLQEFFYSHTEETINRRYGFTLTRMTRERASRLVSVNQYHDLAMAIFELRGPRQIIHAVGRYYLDEDGKSAEMAFVVSEMKRRLGMARLLLETMMDIAQRRGLEHLWAQVDNANQGMLTLFRKMGALSEPSDDPAATRITLPLQPNPPA